MILVLAQMEGQIIFVSQNGTGNGTSWNKAMGDLHKALAEVGPGEQIWVSAGTYFTSKADDRNKSFVIPSGIELYGGFAGVETSIGQRDPKHHITYLSGEIGSSSNLDNAFTVIYTENVSANTIVDGFYITGGNANGNDKSRPLEYRGGGWYNLATGGKDSSPSISHCIFTQNLAKDGAGMLNLALQNSNCRPKISYCTFTSNKAKMNGGALINLSMKGNCEPQINHCTLEMNTASYGAGIYNKPWSGSVKPHIQSCTFKKNKALVSGGSIHNEYSKQGACQPTTKDNHYIENSASVGKEHNSPGGDR